MQLFNQLGMSNVNVILQERYPKRQIFIKRNRVNGHNTNV